MILLAYTTSDHSSDQHEISPYLSVLIRTPLRCVVLTLIFFSLDDPSLTVGELFLSGVGGAQLRRHLAHVIKTSQEMQGQAPCLLWSTFFNQAVYTLMDLMYPYLHKRFHAKRSSF